MYACIHISIKVIDIGIFVRLYVPVCVDVCLSVNKVCACTLVECIHFNWSSVCARMCVYVYLSLSVRVRMCMQVT